MTTSNNYLKLSDIPKFPKTAYEITIEGRGIIRHLEHEKEDLGLNLNPEYQRGHVWTEAQQIAYVEYRLKGGESGDVILTNCPGWMVDFRGPYELIDGKQRLTAVLRFLNNEIKVFGHYRKEYIDSNRISVLSFKWRVFSLEKRSDILKLYLDINSGGTPHTAEELSRVEALMKQIG